MSAHRISRWRLVSWLRYRWQLFLCRAFNRHSMVFYSVGHNFGRECWACKRPGLMSEADWDWMRSGIAHPEIAKDEREN